jgi:transketolase
MGDLISESVTSDLFYIPKSEFDFVLDSKLNKIQKAEIIASMCRVNTLYMIAKAGSGHIGSSFSSMEIMTWINLFEIDK